MDARNVATEMRPELQHESGPDSRPDSAPDSRPTPNNAPVDSVAAAPAPQRPLCVDLDGTLIRTDLAVEHLLQLLKRNPLYVFLLPIWLWHGIANLKHEIAKRVPFDASQLPYNEPFLAYLRAEKASGRRLVLATAADVLQAQTVADHLGLFTTVFASDGRTNLSANAKRRRLEQAFGRGEFDYAGNARADLIVWPAAAEAIVVSAEPGVLAALRGRRTVARVFDNPAVQPGTPVWRPYVKAMRLHQWLKNGLLFVPLAMAHKLFEPAAFLQVCIAFLAFGLTASAVYLLNDMVDLKEDRRHPTKCRRPFAAGSIPLTHGLALVPTLLLVAFALASLLPVQFVAVLAAYFAATLAYSFYFKRTMLFDVLVLAGLYTLRIIAGSAALGIPRSFWLLAFSIFLFFSLALVKRYVELRDADDGKSQSNGRAYRAADLETLSQFGITSGMAAVLVLALYIDSTVSQKLYRSPEVIWLLCPLMLYLICRIWILARRGDMHEDPIMFAIRDWRSQVIVGVGAALLLLATVL
jgi:4-hydroxybenzoate polyprenyltransferase